MKYNILTIVAFLFIFTGCSNILDETPDNRTTIDSIDKISELLVAAYPEAGYVGFLEPMSDNADDKGPSETTEIRVNKDMYFWKDLNETDEDTPSNYWNSAYEAISQANQALASIEELGGGTEFDTQRGEALVCRAYAHFMLVNIFSKPYNPTTASSDIGIPYVIEPEIVLLGNYSRGSVKGVYDNIKKDLEKGLPLIKDKYKVPAFHFTKKAASAFASRFYLTIGEWQKTIDHSSIALGNTNDASVLRDTENVYTNLTFNEQVALYTSSTREPANLLLVTANSIYNRIEGVGRYLMTPNIVSDLFRTNATGKDWAYPLYFRGNGQNNTLVPKYDEYFKVTNQSAGIGIAFVTFVLFSTDEALLNRAEAHAMLGNLDSAREDINLSFSIKTEGYNPATDKLTNNEIATFFAITDPTLYTPFYTIPATSLPFVNAVLVMKRTIFYNEGLRWFDIKRHNISIEHLDVFGNSFLLPKDDKRRQVQIPEAAQSFGIEANPR